MRRKNTRVNRVSQIIRFFRVSRLLLWTIWVIYRERKRVVRARERGNYDVQPNIEVLIQVLVAFRKAAIQLGVLMIKPSTKNCWKYACTVRLATSMRLT